MEAYIKFSLSSSDVKKINKLIAQKLNLIELKDPLKQEGSITRSKILSNLSKQGNTLNPSQLQAERVYMLKNSKMAKEQDIYWDLFGTAQKHTRSKKSSQSENFRRFKISQDWYPSISDFSDTNKQDLALFFENIRREPEIYKNNQNSLVTMIKKYREKEKKWLKDKEDMRSEMICLKEELNAIKNFIMSEKSLTGELDNMATNKNAPVPAFIRAWHIPFDDELAPKISLNVTQPFSRDLTPNRNLNVKLENNSYLVSPLIKNEVVPMFYPAYSERQNSLQKTQKSISMSNILVANNFEISSSRNSK